MTSLTKYLGTAILIIFFSDISEARPTRYHFQNSNSKAISMAGAFTAVQDFHNSLSWNAAGLILAKDRTKLKDEKIMKFNFDKFVKSFGLGYRSKLFGISKSKYLDISLGALLNNNEQNNRNEVSATMRISF